MAGVRAVAGMGRGAALRFVVFLGVVSLLADMTYEGGRSITGPFLAQLGASATVVGVFAGLGELLGYGLRLGSGYLSDRSGKYWPVTIIGYLINLFAMPALALAGRWEVAVGLMMLERTGKAIRKPARDAMLAHATAEMGRGWGFGLHKAMDQTGALIGPVVISAVLLATGGNYRTAFALLLVPALLSFIVLLAARREFPRPSDLEVATPEIEGRGIPRLYWIYLGASALVAAGYADFPLIAYHFAKDSVMPVAWIPLVYAVAMGTAAVSALVAGWLFDRVGMPVLVVAVLLSALFAPLVFLGGVTMAVAGMALWGVGMGVQSSVIRAAVAGMVSTSRRASAYGIFDAGYGVFWFIGSALMGILYDRSTGALIAFSVAAQLAALPLLIIVAARSRTGPR
ncbi:MAG TPA: MFS transporter [Gemmatimonadaceae bacterium]